MRAPQKAKSSKLLSLASVMMILTIGGCQYIRGCDQFLAGTPIVKGVRPKTFVGQWISTTYANSVVSSHSAREAQLSINGVSHINIPASFLEDRIFVGRNVHDGSFNRVLFEKEKATLQVYEAGQQVGKSADKAEIFLLKSGQDTLLSYVDLETKKTTRFYRIPPTDLVDFQGFINRELIAGTYTAAKDSNRVLKGKEIIFLSRGEVRGHRYFKKYKVWTDFYDDVPQVDFIAFSDKRGKEYWYALKSDSQTLILFEFANKRGRTTTIAKGNTATSMSKIGPIYLSLKKM